MFTIFRLIMAFSIASIALIAFSSCEGGLIIELGNIVGPDSVKENYTVEYSIAISSGTNIKYWWSCSPPYAGKFESPSAATTKFTAAEVDIDTPIELQAIVTTDQQGSVVKKINVTILNRRGWVRTWDADWANDVAIDGQDNIYVAGTFMDSDDFDPGPGTDVHISNGGDDVYLIKLSLGGDFIWARTWGGEGDDSTYNGGVVVDQSGNAYVAGTFQDSVDFDPGPGTDIYTADGYTDIFICKYGSNGDYLWAHTWGGPFQGIPYIFYDDICTRITSDNNDDIYLTGTFGGPADFDPGPGVDQHLDNGGTDAFIAKYDSECNLHWARTWGGPKGDMGFGIDVDDYGHLYVIGEYMGTCDFDPGPGTDEHTAPDNGDVFLSKFDADGNFEWSRTWGESSIDVLAVASDNSGSAYVIGSFNGGVDFDPGPGASVFISTVDDKYDYFTYDAYLAKFGPDGDFNWVNVWGGESSDEGCDVIVDGSGNVYVTGGFEEGAVDFDTGPGIDIYETDGYDAYLVKFNVYGDYYWARTWGYVMNSFGFATGRRLAIDSRSNIFVTGEFVGALDFDPGPGLDIHDSMGFGNNTFLSKFPADGDW